MSLKVLKPFSWAHRGIDVVHYEAGQPIDPETDDAEMIEVGEREGWIGTGEEKSSGGKAAK